MTSEKAPDYLRRESGILLHPTSLPGPHGIGDLGAQARDFVDFLQAAGQRLWQVLPLGPTGYGNSPYAARSAMAGNPLLVSLDLLAEEALLSREELTGTPPLKASGIEASAGPGAPPAEASIPAHPKGGAAPAPGATTFPIDRVDYPKVASFKLPLLRQAHGRFQSAASPAQRSALLEFCMRNASWLEDFALFMALEEANRGVPWQQWEGGAASRRTEALEAAQRDLRETIDFHRFAQFQFSRQWGSLKRYASERGVRLIGDIPIFVALQSADVWARRELFYLDEQGFPTVVAGVPPDYFSRTGQRWGNPLYRWDVLEKERHGWWVDRFRATLAQVDLVRIDHFRGFEAYWEVPAQHETAEQGRWVPGPGAALFRAAERQLGTLPVIAEDLGTITPEVEALRLQLGYPGMKVLHFAFEGGATNPYLPHNYGRRYVAYTGTHDNDTTVGWFQSRPARERDSVLRYLGTQGQEIHWELIRLAYSSVAEAVVVPLQDILGLDSSARMNLPGQAEGNWGWRFAPQALTPMHAERLKELSATYGRG